DVRHTWWRQAAFSSGLDVLVNNSWSGDQLGGTSGKGLTRCDQLHDDTGSNAGTKPDIIAVFFGTNDLGRNVAPETFESLYTQMVDKMQAAYPGADIFLFTLLNCSDLDVTTEELYLYNDIIRNIASEYYSLNSRRSKMLDTLMRTLLLKVSETGERRDNAQQTVEPHYSALIDLRAKIYRNPQLKWNVDTMAADVNMSRSYFQHIYREVFGVSCIADVISGKIEKAKEILSETSCTVSQVAVMCGYDNEEHFMRQFKKIVGVTPSKYRKKA
ncbi:MAG: AraC family transcriptional regulator, partial [Ruminococcus sp.]|nr:AraC family transcriptional regulator [Ruminococcus sp.]